MQQALQILKQYWHYSSFRPQQEAIIQSVADGKDTLALLPTGGGKSLCFQVPALMKEGLCLVISPLIALMKDQVENLQSKGIPALSIHSGLNFYEVKKTLNNALHGNFKFLYVSPERLETSLFKDYLPELNINLVAVDEAHCVSQWGYDFRPPYLRIAQLREALPRVNILALTASATPLVQDDIIEKLQFKNHQVFRQGFERPNLSYSVFNVSSKINKTIDVLQHVPGSSIVYCRNRKLTKEVSQLLALHNIHADFYHAGLSQEERSKKQDAWKNNATRVMVCTNAFGMGIDKPDVRTVIHYDIPDCLEYYYQEAGRAGRDEKKSYAVLLYRDEEIKELEALPGKRYPLMYDIRKVYQSLADFLQVPVGAGEGIYYDFNLNEFVKTFKIDIHLVISVLKTLEQEGFLGFNENIFIPAKLMFAAPKEVLAGFEQSYPALEPVIKCLLRTYEGIYENRVSINEKLIARLIKRKEEEIKTDLQRLQSFGIVAYEPQKETPQILFLTARAPAQHLHINHEYYRKRKQQYELRIEAMIKYVTQKKNCRSNYIASYFGTHIPDCKICDTCLQHKQILLSPEEFEHIQKHIYHHVQNGGMAVKELLQYSAAIQKDKLWKVMNYLQAEKKLTVSESGIVKIQDK